MRRVSTALDMNAAILRNAAGKASALHVTRLNISTRIDHHQISALTVARTTNQNGSSTRSPTASSSQPTAEISWEANNQPNSHSGATTSR